MKIRLLCFAVLLFLVLPVGCKEAPPDPNAPYAAAINAYWRVHPRCLWTQAVRMPAEEMPNGARISGLRALTDLGFLQPTQPGAGGLPAAKGMLAFDLTDKGREAWTAVPHMKGLGNFCFGHRSVTSVDSIAPVPPSQSAIEAVVVKYHFSLPDEAPWVMDAKVQSAFPEVTPILAAKNDTATLMKTSGGWVMTTQALPAPAPPPARKKSHFAAPAKDPWAAESPSP